METLTCLFAVTPSLGKVESEKLGSPRHHIGMASTKSAIIVVEGHLESQRLGKKGFRLHFFARSILDLFDGFRRPGMMSRRRDWTGVDVSIGYSQRHGSPTFYLRCSTIPLLPTSISRKSRENKVGLPSTSLN